MKSGGKTDGEIAKPKEMPTFDEMRIFHEAWEAIQKARTDGRNLRSVRQIAIAMGISHVSLMDNLARIEAKYGTKLIERNSFTLTTTGEAVVKWTHKVIQAYREGERVQHDNQALDITVAIAIFPADVIMDRLIEIYSKSTRAIKKLHFVRQELSIAFDGLTKGGVHLWIGPASALVEQEGSGVVYKYITPPLKLVEYRSLLSTKGIKHADLTWLRIDEHPTYGQHKKHKRVITVPSMNDALRLLRYSMPDGVCYGVCDVGQMTKPTTDGIKRIPTDLELTVLDESNMLSLVTKPCSHGSSLCVGMREDANASVRGVLAMIEDIAKTVWVSSSPASGPEAPKDGPA